MSHESVAICLEPHIDPGNFIFFIENTVKPPIALFFSEFHHTVILQNLWRELRPLHMVKPGAVKSFFHSRRHTGAALICGRIEFAELTSDSRQAEVLFFPNRTQYRFISYETYELRCRELNLVPYLKARPVFDPARRLGVIIQHFEDIPVEIAPEVMEPLRNEVRAAREDAENQVWSQAWEVQERANEVIKRADKRLKLLENSVIVTLSEEEKFRSQLTDVVSRCIQDLGTSHLHHEEPSLAPSLEPPPAGHTLQGVFANVQNRHVLIIRRKNFNPLDVVLAAQVWDDVSQREILRVILFERVSVVPLQLDWRQTPNLTLTVRSYTGEELMKRVESVSEDRFASLESVEMDANLDQFEIIQSSLSEVIARLGTGVHNNGALRVHKMLVGTGANVHTVLRRVSMNA